MSFRRRECESGFSLAEALVALAILAILALLPIALYVRYDRSAALLRERLAACDFVETQLEMLRAAGTAPLGSYTWDLSDQPIATRLAPPIVLRLDSETVPGFDSLRHVILVVSWKGGESESRRARLETYLGGRGRER